MPQPIPSQLLLLQYPFDRDGHKLDLGDVPWSESMADKALSSIRLLAGIFRSGYPVVHFNVMADGRSASIGLELSLNERLTTTYADFANPEHRLLDSLDSVLHIRGYELSKVLETYVPSAAQAAVSSIENWLAKQGNSKVDWQGAQPLLALASENWRHLPEFFADALVACAAQVNRKRSFPLLQEIIASPDASKSLKRTCDYVGSLIERPIDPRMFDIPPPQG